MNRQWKGLFSPKFSLDDEAKTRPGENRKLFERIHRSRENNPKLHSEKKKKFLKRNGHLCCEICLFDFEKAYGQPGKGVIEFHHTKPVAKLSAGEKTRLSDLALVCSNCHSMLHRTEPCMTIEELKGHWNG